MTAVILTFHVLIVLGLIVMVLLQRSDGGALGIGGGGGGGGFMSGRGAANALTRTTSILAAIFFSTSLGLAILAGSGETEETVIEELTGEAAPDPDAGPVGLTTEDLLNTLGDDNADESADNAPGLSISDQDALDALEAEISADQDAEAPPMVEEAEEGTQNE